MRIIVISCGLTGGLSHVNHSRFMWFDWWFKPYVNHSRFVWSDWWFKPCVNHGRFMWSDWAKLVVSCGLTGGLAMCESVFYVV